MSFNIEQGAGFLAKRSRQNSVAGIPVDSGFSQTSKAPMFNSQIFGKSVKVALEPLTTVFKFNNIRDLWKNAKSLSCEDLLRGFDLLPSSVILLRDREYFALSLSKTINDLVISMLLNKGNIADISHFKIFKNEKKVNTGFVRLINKGDFGDVVEVVILEKELCRTSQKIIKTAHTLEFSLRRDLVKKVTYESSIIASFLDTCQQRRLDRYFLNNKRIRGLGGHFSGFSYTPTKLNKRANLQHRYSGENLFLAVKSGRVPIVVKDGVKPLEFSIKNKLKVLSQIGRGFNNLRENKLVHGDGKLTNVLLESNGENEINGFLADFDGLTPVGSPLGMHTYIYVSVMIHKLKRVFPFDDCNALALMVGECFLTNFSATYHQPKENRVHAFFSEFPFDFEKEVISALNQVTWKQKRIAHNRCKTVKELSASLNSLVSGKIFTFEDSIEIKKIWLSFYLQRIC